MFAIAFDLDYNNTQAFHPAGVRQAYREIDSVMGRYGYRRIQQSVFMHPDDDLVSVTKTLTALRALPWFSACAKDIRAFRVENWSDFTSFFSDNQ